MTVSGIPITPNTAQSLLQVLLPGETAVPGAPNGKTGTPNSLQAGANLAITVNATDNQWNRLGGVNTQVQLTALNDSYSIVPGVQAMTEGQFVFSDANAYKPFIACAQTLRADDVDGMPPLYASTTTLLSRLPGAGKPFPGFIAKPGQSGRALVGRK